MSEAHVGYIELEDVVSGRLEPAVRLLYGKSLKFWKDADDRPGLGREWDVTLFGAVFDGSTDDTTKIEDCHDAMSDGDVMILPSGKTGIISSKITFTKSIHVRGHRTTLEAKSATGGQLQAGASGSEITSFSMEGVMLDLTNASAGTFALSIFITDRCHLKDVHVLNATADGIVVSGDSGTTIPQVLLEQCSAVGTDTDGIELATTLYGGVLLNCYTENTNQTNLGAAIYLRGPDQVAIGCRVSDANDNGIRITGARSKAIDCEVTDWDTDGIRLQADYTQAVGCYVHDKKTGATTGHCIRTENCTGGKVHRCRCHDGNSGVRIYTGSARISVVDCELSDADTQSGIHITAGDRHRLIGNTCWNNNLDGIRITDSSYGICAFNYCFDDQGTKTQDYGIQSSGTSDNWQVFGNFAAAADHVTGGITLVGSANDVYVPADCKLRSDVNVNNYLLVDDGSGNAEFASRSNITLDIDSDNNATTKLLQIRRDGSSVVWKADEPDTMTIAVLTDATRPSAGNAGRIIYNSTDGNLNIDDGTNWILPDGTTT